jgi:hypothetical protein
MTNDIQDENRNEDTGLSFDITETTPTNSGTDRSDDDITRDANTKITEWKAAGTPSIVEVQKLFHASICANASAMARDNIIAAIFTAFGSDFCGKKALLSTWIKIEKDDAAECAQAARDRTTKSEMTAAEKAEARESLWPVVRELAEAPDLIDRMVRQVHDLGVVNEDELIKLIYIAATSRITTCPVMLWQRARAALANRTLFCIR